jgi:hypothetical protein
MESRLKFLETDDKPTEEEVLAHDGQTFNALNLAASPHFPQIAVQWLQTTQPLPQFAAEVRQDASRKLDHDAELTSIEVAAAMGPLPLTIANKHSNSPAWYVEPFAAEQLGARLDVPNAVTRYLLEDRPDGKNRRDIAATVLNQAFDDYAATHDNADDKKLLIRAKRQDDGTKHVRAFMSSGYTMLDNDVVVDALDKMFHTSGVDARVSHLNWDGNRMGFNLVLPDSMTEAAEIIDPQTDSAYLAHIKVSNDERGGGKVRLTPGLIRAICLNGTIHGLIESEIKFEQIHRGFITPEMVAAQMAQVIGKWGERHIVREILQQIQAVKTIEVPNVKAAIASLIQDNSLPKRMADPWAIAYNEEVRTLPALQGTAFSVIQGLTRAARDWSVDDRDVAERLSGRLAMPLRGESDAAWKKIRDRAGTLSEQQVEQYVTVNVA